MSFRFTLSVGDSRATVAVALQELKTTGWHNGDTIWARGQATTGAGEIRLGEGVIAIRCRLDPPRGWPEFTDPLLVDVRRSPPVLILLSMGGAWTGSPATPPGPAGAQAILEDHGIRVDEDRCRLRGIPSGLIRSLTTNGNIQCNDLCDEDCVNFLEHLGLRLMNDEGLANELFSHNAIARSHFVHDKTVTFIREAISSVRGRARGGHAATFRLDANGSLGERIDLRRLLPIFSVVRAFQLDGADYVCFVAKSDGRTHIWRVDEHGMLGAIISDESIPAGFASAAFYTIGDATFVLLVKDAYDQSLILRINPDGSIGPRRYPNTPAEQLSGPLRGPWDHAEAFRQGNSQFLAVAKSDGEIRIVQVESDGRPGSVVPRPISGLGRLSSIVFYSIGASGYLFTVGDGMSVFRMNGDGSVGPRIWQEATPFAQLGSWTAAHLRVDNTHSLLLHDAVGNMQIRRVDADGSIGPTLFQGNTGRTGGQALTTYETAGAGYALLVQRAL